MIALKITVVGAPDTGRSRLAQALDLSLKDSGLNALVTISGAATPETADLIFLMGLESADAASVDADQAIRERLMRASVAHEVLYGPAEERFAQALGVIEKRLSMTFFSGPASEKPFRSPRQWKWACDKCGDPQCEHRLLTDLLAGRAAARAIEA